MSAPAAVPLLGAILAGGRNTRYGEHKALAEVAGARIVDRVRAALAEAADPIVMIANEPEVYGALGLPMRPDARPGLGPLGGIHAALLWARERGAPGVLAVACDMPFVPGPLLRRLAEAARVEEDGSGPPDVVVPESTSRRGVEPLCAAYSVGCIEAIEGSVDRGERHMISFFEDVRVRTLPIDAVRAFGEPEVLFMNVNTPEERRRAEELASAGGAE